MVKHRAWGNREQSTLEKKKKKKKGYATVVKLTNASLATGSLAGRGIFEGPACVGSSTSKTASFASSSKTWSCNKRSRSACEGKGVGIEDERRSISDGRSLVRVAMNGMRQKAQQVENSLAGSEGMLRSVQSF
jgi:hypothetical protein